VYLDTGPLGALCNVRGSLLSVACNRWLRAWTDAGGRIVIPEIADYEVRRELLRLNRRKSLQKLDWLTFQYEYLPLTTSAMRQAAELWALARQQGFPTAANSSIDCDVNLAAQFIVEGEPAAIVATTNVTHLARFVPADTWHNITP
jgi:predicted nucleic acid-binding protein